MIRLPLNVQVGAVVALFVAAIVTLWTTGITAVAGERRRFESKGLLTKVGQEMALGGEKFLAMAPRWPETLGPAEWDRLNVELTRVSSNVLQPYEGVEGGFYARDSERFLGGSFPTARHPFPKKQTRGDGRFSGPPPREFDLIESQVIASIRRSEILFVVEDVPPSTVALRTAPIVAKGRIIGATWTMIRLTDPVFVARSVRGYRLASGLALVGIALSLFLMMGMVRTVRRQTVERERLQGELRRSERLAALGKLLAGVAHEVRNPLAGIRSTVQLWQRGLALHEEGFSGVVAEVDRLDGIVTRLLHFSRASSLDMAPGDLNAVVSEAAQLAQVNADSKHVRIELDLAPYLPETIMAPPALLQVFRNLTGNAIQAMSDGGTLRLETRYDKADSRIEARVIDNGPGLSEEVRAHLFEPFYTTRVEGTGLGLAIAREIVLAHHGELTAETRDDHEPGAVFVLRLKVISSANAGANAL